MLEIVNLLFVDGLGFRTVQRIPTYCKWGRFRMFTGLVAISLYLMLVPEVRATSSVSEATIYYTKTPNNNMDKDSTNTSGSNFNRSSKVPVLDFNTTTSSDVGIPPVDSTNQSESNANHSKEATAPDTNSTASSDVDKRSVDSTNRSESNSNQTSEIPVVGANSTDTSDGDNQPVNATSSPAKGCSDSVHKDQKCQPSCSPPRVKANSTSTCPTNEHCCVLKAYENITAI